MELSRKIKLKIALSCLLSTSSLYTPVKTIFLLHFLMQEQDISFFKFIFTLAAFVFELPSGYLSDKFGNRLCLILSRLFSIASLLFYCVSPNFAGFLTANFLLGMADAWESGAKDSYFLMLCQALNIKYNTALEYREIKISVTKSSYWMNFVLMFFSTFLYDKNVFYPFIGSAVLLAASAGIILTLPPDKMLAPQKSEKEKLFLDETEFMIHKIISNKPLLIEMFYTIICTSIYIINFEYYAVAFRQASIPDSLIGPIYAGFMLINSVGVLIYQRKSLSPVRNLLLILSPFSFVLIISGYPPAVLAAVVIQQLCYSYYNCNFEIYVLDSIDDLSQSSYFQSTIGFINVVNRMTLTLIVTALFARISFEWTYIVFALIILGASLCKAALSRLEARKREL